MIRAMRQQLPESSLSIWTLATQMILFLLLGISYIVRLGKRGTGFNKPLNVPMDLYTWYRLVVGRTSTISYMGLAKAFYFSCTFTTYTLTEFKL